MNAVERNAHWGVINSRFDERAQELLGMGFKYTGLGDYGIAVFTRVRIPGMRPDCLPAAFVMHADSVCWSDRLNDLTS